MVELPEPVIGDFVAEAHERFGDLADVRGWLSQLLIDVHAGKLVYRDPATGGDGAAGGAVSGIQGVS